MNVCENRKVLYIKGHRGSSSSKSSKISEISESSESSDSKSDNAAKEAFQEWFQVGDEDFVIIKNDSLLASLLKFEILPVSDGVVADIHNHVEAANRRCRCDKIHVIIIAHSHGAKCVVEAFRCFRKTPGEMKKIHKSTAIITLGPIEFVEDNTANVAYNYRFINDNISNWYIETPPPNAAPLHLLGPFIRTSKTKFECKCCVGLQPYDEQEEEESWLPIHLSTARFMEAVEAFTTILAAIASVTSGVQSRWVKAHYITDYIKCRHLKYDLMQKFTLP